jgi:hypothetical protein
MVKKFLPLVISLLLLSTTLVSAQQETAPPYLYYYSRILGGIIIERADGSDSRLIGADVIPPGMTGLSGPGWSPSGRYFAASGVDYQDYGTAPGAAFVINTNGESQVSWLQFVLYGGPMAWSPEEDLLLVSGNTIRNTAPYQLFFWLTDPKTDTVLAEFGVVGYGTGDVDWDMDAERVVFYMNPETFTQQYLRITMHFGGMVLKEPITRAEFEAHYTEPDYDASDPLHDAYGISPSGRYEATGKYPTILRDLTTETEIELPTHSQGTICRAYTWSADEQYIITLDGTLVAGGGCAGAMIGITDTQGQLWRELGGCSWGATCVDWLPSQVDVNTLSPGQPQPVQLDPVGYEAADILYGYDFPTAEVRILCIDYPMRHIIDAATGDVLFELNDTGSCPYNQNDSFMAGGLGIVTAYDPTHNIWATYGWGVGVSIWTTCDGVGIRIKRLNSDGYLLEFTPDGQQLRARNVNAWKIYNVQDILDSAEAHCSPSE